MAGIGTNDIVVQMKLMSGRWVMLTHRQRRAWRGLVRSGAEKLRRRRDTLQWQHGNDKPDEKSEELALHGRSVMLISPLGLLMSANWRPADSISLTGVPVVRHRTRRLPRRENSD